MQNNELVSAVRVIIWSVEVGNVTRDAAARAIIPLVLEHAAGVAGDCIDGGGGPGDGVAESLVDTFRQQAAAIRGVV